MLYRRAFFILILGVLAHPAAADERSRSTLAPDMQRIFDRGRLIVAVSGADAPPFVMTGVDNKLAGYDIDLAEGMGKALGVPVGFDRSAHTANEVIDVVARGAADLAISKLIATPDRAVQVRFSRPYLTLRQALLFNRLRFAQLAKGRQPIDVINEPDMSIAVVSGGAYGDYAKRLLPRAHIEGYSAWQPDILDAVLHGVVAAGYGDEVEIRRLVAARPDAPLQLRTVILDDLRDPLAVALPWPSAQLLAWVDLYLETSVASVTVDELLARYPTSSGAPAGRP